ncbi:MAG: SH3 domain-containing protein [Steroidobacteraceae bacterium]|nr:SH3 domain-containing protein [Steroidobacteraceae bacterium]MDW8257840.1 SH3 domain-containing protein [Gammaproteobacteria bacterium]
MLLVCVTAASPDAAARQREYLQLFVTEPYLELRTGPGRGYPVTQVVTRGEAVDVLFRRTDYFKLRTERGVEGWANVADLLKTQLADGSPFSIDLGDRAGYQTHRWEVGIFAGDFDGASAVSAYGALSLTDNLKVELNGTQYFGDQRSGWMIEAALTHVFAPEWRLSPYLTVGGGLFRVEKDRQRPNLVDRFDESAYAGVGARFYLTRRFFLRAEAKQRVIFTSRNDNEELEEWKVGLAFFF